MRVHLSTLILLALLASGAAPPEETTPGWDADARLVYESDTRAYYRPCG